MKTILLILALAGSLSAEVGVSLYTNGITKSAADARYVLRNPFYDGSQSVTVASATSLGNMTVNGHIYTVNPSKVYADGFSGYSGADVTMEGAFRFAGPSFSVGTSTLVVTGGKVGINVASPTTDLQIGDYSGNRTIKVTAGNNESATLELKDYNNNYGASLVNDSNGGNILLKRHNNSSSGVTVMSVPRATGVVSFPEGKFDVGTSTLVVSAGQIGFGGTPSYSVHAKKGMDAGVSYQFDRTAGGSGSGYTNFVVGNSLGDDLTLTSTDRSFSGTIYTNGGSGNQRGLGTANAVPLVFANAGTARMIIDATGDVSILQDGFSVGTSTLVVANGRMGLGSTPLTTYAGHLLQVDGLGANQAFIDIKHSGVGTGALDGLHIGLDNTEASIIQRENLPLNFYTNGTDRGGFAADGTFDIGGSTLVVSAGKVGIGTTSPATFLEIKGKDVGAVSEMLRIQGGSALDEAGGVIGFKPNAADATWNMAQIGAVYNNYNSGWGGDIIFRTNNSTLQTDISEKMRILYNGNVGIGTTTPNSLLTIGNTGTSSETQARLYAGSGKPSAVAFGANGAEISGYIGVAGANNDITLGATAGDLAIRTGAGKAILLNNDAGIGGPALYIAPTTKNIGINTAYQPDAKLHISSGTIKVDGNVSPGIMVSRGDGGAADLMVTDNVAGYNYATDGMHLIHTGATSYIGNRENGSLILFTNGSDRAAIDSAGRMGIGTITPAAKLHVSSSAIIVDGDDPIMYVNDTNGVSTFMQSVDGAWRLYDGADYSIYSKGGKVGFGTANPAAKVHLSSGYVVMDGTDPRLGIGTASPLTALDVRGTLNLAASGSDAAINGGSNTRAILKASVTGGTYIYAYDNDTTDGVVIRNYENNTNLLTVLNGGNVGISSATPTSQLVVGAGGKTWIDGYASGVYAFNYSGNTLSSGTVLENAHDSGYLAKGIVAFSTHTAGEVYPIGTLYDTSCAANALCRVCTEGLCPAKLESGSDCDIANVAVLVSAGEDGRAACAVSPGTAVHNGEIGQVQEFSLVNGDTVNMWAHRN